MSATMKRSVIDTNLAACTGNISQWGEVKKKTKDRARSKVKDAPSTSAEPSVVPSRGARGRGSGDGSRGGRGRATERGRGAGRGFRGGAGMTGGRPQEKASVDTSHEPSTNPPVANSTSILETPTGTSDQAVELSENSASGDKTSTDTSWEMVAPVDTIQLPAAEAQNSSLKPDGTRSWATLFAKPLIAATRSKAPLPAPIQELVPDGTITQEIEQAQADEPGLPPPFLTEDPTETPATPRSSGLSSLEQVTKITPSKDELTETNLELVPDTSNPPATATAASTVASTQDPRNLTENNTPLHVSQTQSAGLRPGLGGFATTAYKATSGAGRSASFQRRVMEQQEAVVMPGNHAVDRTAVQFGSMGLNGTSEDLDVDDDREDAETRTQPPQHSPVAPRAALPPAPQQPQADTLPTPRQAPGLPPAAPQPMNASAPQGSQPDPALPATTTQGNYPYHQFANRYGPPTSQQDPTGSAPKAYEPFGQQIQQPTAQQHPAQQHQYDGYPSQSQTSGPQQPSAQPSQANFSSAATDYSSYYTSDNQRNAYQNYYGSYGQPSQPAQPEAGATQPRGGSGFVSSSTEQPSQYATSQGQQQPQARYGSAGDIHNSGHSTPNPVLGQQGQMPSQQSHPVPQQQGQGQASGQHGAYPYGHPYYNNPYYSYMNQVSHHSYGRERPMFDDVRRYDDQYLTHNNQFGYGGNQGGYGAGPYGGAGSKQGMYGQPHQGYGMSPQTSYDHHSASPATVGGYGQQSHSAPGRDGTTSNMGGAYGRTGSAQPSESQQHTTAGTAGAFAGMPDVFGRSQGSYSGQGQSATQPQSGPSAVNDESVRGYGDASKMTGGPSPAPGQASGRPGSATNAIQGQTGLPSSQNQSQQSYGGYPSQMNPQMHGQQGSQYNTGLGGLGGHHQAGGQNHQGSGYGGGYGGAFGGYNYGTNNRGGWGGNYGH